MQECSWKNLGQMKIMRGKAREKLLNTLRITNTELIPARCSVYELAAQHYLIFSRRKFLKRLCDEDWWVAISPTDEILGVKVDNEFLTWQFQYFHSAFIIGNQETGQLVKFTTDPIYSHWIYSMIAE